MFPIDLKSDTVTRPSERMREIMSNAEVGDDVYGEDPSVNSLQEKAAAILGMEAAIFLPSGTMGNLVAILAHCGRGEGAIIGKNSHIYINEGGGLAALGGVVPLTADDSSGLIPPSEIEENCRPVNVHFAPAKLLCIENTHNRCGGLALSPEQMKETTDSARKNGLSVHIDGARIFNAAAAWDCDVKEFASQADSIQFCLSKGLGAPIGSILCGQEDYIGRALHWRKKLGGGLRQAGIMAAAGIYALENNIDRLREDHENAVLIAEGLSAGGLEVEKIEVPTNMVYFHVPQYAADLHVRCREKGLLFNAASDGRIRLVTHIDVSREQVLEAVDVILQEVFRK
ncbi:MAG: low-specificity L-threonine aldolase [Synergistaceae bacterium]|nr:low-specificity L-threonine aldolase [Synergistaceae bacterium]